METGICKGRYTHAEKIKALRILESNNFNYLQTNRQIKISRPTLRKWEHLYGKEVFKGKSPTEEALVEIDAEMKHNDISIIRSLYSLRKRTLHRVMTMAEKETKLESLVNVLKYVSGELQKFSDLEKAEPETTTDFVAYITKIMFGKKDGQPEASDQE